MTEEVESEAVVSKSKQLVRSHALCGDDDTKLTVSTIAKQLSSKSSSLSRESSNELYTDATSGLNLEDFIKRTLHKNRRDREQLLKLEATFRDFISNQNEKLFRFPTMSSYNRMLVHRVSAFFGLDHNVDQTGNSVIVTKSKGFRLPDKFFTDYILNDNFVEEDPKHLRRDVQSFEDTHVDLLADIRKARSFEERDYSQSKLRNVHNQESSSSAEGILESHARPWSSTESSSESCGNHHHNKRHFNPNMMHKACSYGGSPVLYQHRPETPMKINVQGYPPDVLPQQASLVDMSYLSPTQPVVFAVTNLAQVPPGAMILDPVSMQPYLNADRSIYRHDPLLQMTYGAPCRAGPPVVLPPPAQVPPGDMGAALAGQLQQLGFCGGATASGEGGAPGIELGGSAANSTGGVPAPMPPSQSQTPMFYDGVNWQPMPPYYTYMVPSAANIDQSGGSTVRPIPGFMAANQFCMQNALPQYLESHQQSAAAAIFQQQQQNQSIINNNNQSIDSINSGNEGLFNNIVQQQQQQQIPKIKKSSRSQDAN